jgi:hypothetical protein
LPTGRPRSRTGCGRSAHAAYDKAETAAREQARADRASTEVEPDHDGIGDDELDEDLDEGA